MSPDDLARLHPRLYHVTMADAWPGISRHGLLSSERLLDLFGVKGARREALLNARRPASVTLDDPKLGRATLVDNIPLTEKALAGCLDDGLTPAEWLALLNARVFFWASEERLMRHLGARANKGAQRLVLEIDTLSLARAHAAKIELCPINSGSTLRKPARRGLGTFTPLGRHSHEAWRRLRGGRDDIVEVTVLDAVPDIAKHLVARRLRRAE